MTLGEELRKKYGLTSVKPKAATLTLLAINEALESAAKIADQENSPTVASHIRCLKWGNKSIAAVSVCSSLTLPKAA